MGTSVVRAKPPQEEPIVDINTTPLIDVMLVLLIMLIITIPIQLHSVNMNNPVGEPPPPPTELPEVVRIDVGADGITRWNGVPVPDRTSLEDQLQELKHRPTQPEVHVRAEPKAAYKHVATIIAAAQRQGLTKVGIVGGLAP